MILDRLGQREGERQQPVALRRHADNATGKPPGLRSFSVATLDDVRAVAAGLPRSYEAFVRGRVKFRVGRIVYLAASRGRDAARLRLPEEWREALVESEPDKYLMPRAGDLRYNWAVVRLGALDEAEARELVVDAWSLVVPQRVADDYAAT